VYSVLVEMTKSSGLSPPQNQDEEEEEDETEEDTEEEAPEEQAKEKSCENEEQERANGSAKPKRKLPKDHQDQEENPKRKKGPSCYGSLV